jgi:magnesium transporter
MITVYTVNSSNGLVFSKKWNGGIDILKDAIWIDICNPDQNVKNFIDEYFNIEIPSSQKILEIEISRRLHFEQGYFYLTVNMLQDSTHEEFAVTPVTLIMNEKTLITVRYDTPTAFSVMASQIDTISFLKNDAENITIGLLKAAIYHIADLLERVGINIENEARAIFRSTPHKKTVARQDFNKILKSIGTNGALTAKARESLVSISRTASYIIRSVSTIHEDGKVQLNILNKDIAALNDHVYFLSSEINFILEATLGMVNIEQNNIIKIFSVASVIFLPPTLIASIYGMNFHFMPELSWKYGYISIVFVMLLSAIVPYLYFKRKKWL